MFPEANLNCTASIAAVTLQYPATNESDICDPDPFITNLVSKCFTNVVLAGLKRRKIPVILSSFSFPVLLKL
jgi:hypothetical protein